MIITILLESYITITISALINLRFPSNETWGEVIGASLGAILSVLNVVVIPIFVIYMFCQTKEQLMTLRGFRKSYGAFYDSFRTESKGTMMGYVVYIYRRVLFVLICLLLKEYPGIQIQCVCLLNLFCSIYYGYFLPEMKLFQNMLQLFNEFMNQVQCVIIMQFTDSNSDPKYQELWGWFFVYSICFMTVVNILVVFWM